ncbi:hypothetical protein Bca4012_072082 [Brassica carinata]
MTGPYLSLCVGAKPLPEGGNIGEVVLFDPAKTELLVLTEKAIPDEIVLAKGLGASKGWAFFCDPQDRCVHITDFMNPWACKSNPKLFTLPPLTSLPSCQTNAVCNAAMSACPDDDKDWVVAIKSLGDQLSFCRPRRDLRWTKITTPLDYFPTSNLMHSKRDGRFYLPGPGGHHLLSYDLNFDKQGYQPEFHELQFRNFPKSFESELELSELFPCSARTNTSYANSRLASKEISYETQQFMVFKEEETTEGRFMCYTDDIGDTCIFISKGEDFCVQRRLSLCRETSRARSDVFFDFLNQKPELRKDQIQRSKLCDRNHRTFSGISWPDLEEDEAAIEHHQQHDFS